MTGSIVVNAVACSSTVECAAVDTDSTDQPIVLVRDPSHWSIADSTQLTLGSTFRSSGQLSAVACPTASWCVAVGSASDNEIFTVTGNPTSSTASQVKKWVLPARLCYGCSLDVVDCLSTTS